MMPLIVGIDLGFGRVKVSAPGYRASFPAVVAEPGAFSEQDGLVEWESERFLVGEAALNEVHHRYAARVDKVTTTEEMIKFLAALALVADHFDTRHLTVATGLPPSHYRDPELKQQMIDRLTGTFTFRFQGRRYAIEVEKVTVDPQAGAALYDYLLLDDGTPDSSNADLLDERTKVVDPGHRTTDIALMRGRKAALGGRSLLTVDQGVWNVLEETSRLLQSEYRVHLSPAAIDALLHTGEELRIHGNAVPLSALVSQAAKPIARSIVTHVLRHSGDVRLWDQALLVGGGMRVFRRILQEELGVPLRPSREPDFSNANGFFKRQLELWLANKQWVLDESNP